MSINVNFRKINVSKQTDYVYHGATGDIVIRPDEKAGITIDMRWATALSSMAAKGRM